MHVLITTDTQGGVWDYSLQLVQGLLARDSKVTMVSMGGLPSHLQAQELAHLQCEFKSHLIFIPTDYPLEWMHDDLRLAESRAFLRSLLSTSKPDLFHANQYCYGDLDCAVPIVLVTHSDVSSWWLNTRGIPPPADSWHRQYHGIVRRGLSGADVIVSPSKFQLDQITLHYALTGKTSRVIPNGCQPRKRPDHKIKQVCTAGRFWDRAKNLQILGQVNWPIPLQVAGTCATDRLADDPWMADTNVRFLGQLPKSSLNLLLDESLVYVGPSLYEPFGLAPLEAAHAGCALLLSDIPSFREIWGDDAIYFSPHDHRSLQHALDGLSSDVQTAEVMGGRAHTRARSLYNDAVFVEAYLGLYQDLCASGSNANVA